MNISTFRAFVKRTALFGMSCLCAAGAVAADSTLNARSTFSLKALYDDAWQRQPEAKAFASRLESMQAQQKVSQSYAPRPPTLEIGGKGEKTQSGALAAGGAGEFIAGVSIPLWLWGERAGSMALADAETTRLIRQQAGAQLKIAAQLRMQFWELELAKIDVSLARSRLQNARNLASDVARRYKAGDLSKADLFQAESTVSSAEGAQADAKANLILAAQNLKGLTGKTLDIEPFIAGSKPSTAALSGLSEKLPKLPQSFADLDSSHPMIQELIAQVEVATKATELAKAQTRQNPELQIYGTSGRPEVGVPIQQTLMLGLKIPFGSDARVQAETLASKANQIDAEERLAYEKQRLLAELDGAKARVETARIRQDAAIRRAQLTAETRAFFEKSFKFGETDLPTRLRIEQDAVDGARQAAQAEIGYYAAISALHQALGLLPQ